MSLPDGCSVIINENIYKIHIRINKQTKNFKQEIIKIMQQPETPYNIVTSLLC